MFNNNDSVPTSQVTVGKKFHMTQRLLKRNGRRGGNDKVDDISAMAAANNTTSPSDDDWDGNIDIVYLTWKNESRMLPYQQPKQTVLRIRLLNFIIGKDHQLEK